MKKTPREVIYPVLRVQGGKRPGFRVQSGNVNSAHSSGGVRGGKILGFQVHGENVNSAHTAKTENPTRAYSFRIPCQSWGSGLGVFWANLVLGLGLDLG